MLANKKRNAIPNLSREFLRACQNGNLAKVKALVAKHDIQDWTVFRHDVSGDTPLHVAAREGHLNTVQYLCEEFEKPEFKSEVANKDMKRPLHEAAQFAHYDVVNYLMNSQEVSVDCLKRADWTPLMLACTNNGSDASACIGALCQAHANPLLRNKDGWTPLHLICRSGNDEALTILLNNIPNCDVDNRTNNGRSAMHIAAFHGHQCIVDLLVTRDSNLLNARDSSGSTPLHEAIKGGHLNVAEHIIKLGADPCAVDKVGQTILHIAALTGNVDAIKYILCNKLIDVHVETFFGETPLSAARRGKKIAAIEVLMENGAEK